MSKFSWTGIAVLALPLIGLPIFPSSYRPVGVLLLVPPTISLLAGALTQRDIKLRAEDVLLLLFFGFALINSFVQTALVSGQWADFLFESALLGLGVSAFFCFRSLIRIEGPIPILLALVPVGIVLIAIGMFEVLSLYGPVPSGLRTTLMEFLNGRAGSRIQLTTSEAAWAARVLLPYLGIMWVLRKRLNKMIWRVGFLLGVFVYVCTFSLEGLATAIFSMVLVGLLFPSRSSLRVIAVGGIASALLFAALSFAIQSDRFGNLGSAYYVTRFAKVLHMPTRSWFEVAELDESIFIRVNYPLISFRMFLENPAVGVGNGSYEDHFPDFLSELGATPMTNSQIVADLINQTGDPRNLFGRVLAENGAVGGILFFGFLYLMYRRCQHPQPHVADETIALSRWFFALSLVGGLQFGSLVYLHNWFMWAFISSAALPTNRTSRSAEG